ncbi:MAG: hypothetical protein U0229_26460 [Anaeromyxobacter sp.]
MPTTLLAIACAAGLGAIPAGWKGEWEGELGFPRRPVVVTLSVQAGPGGALTATLSGLGAPSHLEVRRAAGERVELDVEADGSPANLALVRSGAVLEGTWRGAEAAPVLLRRLPAVSHAPSRVRAWEEDLDALEQRFLRYDRSFSAEARAAFRAASREVRRGLPRLDDAQVVAAIASAVALAGNAHTRLYLVRNRTEVRRLPVRLWSFRDGWYVVAARPALARLAGARVLAIGGKPVAEVERAVARLYAGNEGWRRYLAAYTMTSPETLHGVGVLPAAGPVAFGLELPGGGRAEVVLEPEPLVRSKQPLEAWWDLGPREGWVSALVDPARPPLAVRAPDTRYLLEPLRAGRVLYVRYDRAGDQPGGEPLEAFGARVLDALGPEVERVVVDLRYNTGGDLGVARGFFDLLATRAGAARLVVITGRATFSAGLFHAAQLRLAGARLVGEPVGDRLDYHAEGGNVILPHSGLAAHYANGLHAYSTAPLPPGVVPFVDLDVPSLEPAIRVEPSFEEWRAGKDPALEAALSME